MDLDRTQFPATLSHCTDLFKTVRPKSQKPPKALHLSLLSLSLSLSLHSDEKMKSCEPVTPTTTFLAFLRYSSSSSNCNSQELLRDFATRELNAFLWISLIAITALLLRKVAKLFKLWAQGRKIPGPLCSSFYGHSNLISRENLTGQFSLFFPRETKFRISYLSVSYLKKEKKRNPDLEILNYDDCVFFFFFVN